MAGNYTRPLEIAIQAVLTAGAILRDDFHRPGGPRGAGDHADADVEAEREIRSALTGAFPRWGYVGEETGSARTVAGEHHLWLVDPNDGTRAYLKGYRGSTVSIALLRGRDLVLGVVYAFAAPDGRGDLFSWAEGCGPLRRNGDAVDRRPWSSALGPHDVVYVSQAADRKPAANLARVAPARFRSMPSIAYRLALVAAGDGAVAVSLNSPGAWDYAAGHALVQAVGGEFVNEAGQPVSYSAEGRSRTTYCFGGAPGLVRELAARDWPGLWTDQAEPIEPYDLVLPQRGLAVADPALLSRAQGCLLGQMAGDSLGSLVEFEPAAAIEARYPGGPRRLLDGGQWNTLAGQPTDDTELALMLARSIVERGSYDPEAAARAYRHWYRSAPFDCGTTTRQALQAIREEDVKAGRAAAAARDAASSRSQSNGGLMRISPLGIWGWALEPRVLAGHARDDAALTHRSAVCHEASALFAVTVAHAIRAGCTARELYGFAESWAARELREPRVLEALREAASTPPADFTTQQGWVLVAFQNAFHRLLHAAGVEDTVVETVRRGGDTDTNAAIAGALAGAVYGRRAVPADWQQMVLTCRPSRGFDGIVRPRRRGFWPVDALVLAERLLCLGEHAASHQEA